MRIVLAALALTLCSESFAIEPVTMILPILFARTVATSQSQQQALARAAVLAATAQQNPTQANVQALQDKLRELDGYRIQMEGLLASIEKQGMQLEREKGELQAAKAILESREKLFSFGILAALTTALIALITLVGKLPMLRAERRLKELEIEEKLLHIDALRKRAIQ